MEGGEGRRVVIESVGEGDGRRAGELCVVFFFNDTATTEIYTLSLHDALPIFSVLSCRYRA